MPARAEVEKPAPARDAADATVRVRRYLRFLGCEPALADDCAQEALVAAIEHFGGALPPLPWLLTAARNAFRMQLRRQGRLLECGQADADDADVVAALGKLRQLTRLEALCPAGRLLSSTQLRAALPQCAVTVTGYGEVPGLLLPR